MTFAKMYNQAHCVRTVTHKVNKYHVRTVTSLSCLIIFSDYQGPDLQNIPKNKITE